MIRSLVTWVDLEDGHQYNSGDVFPHDGREIPDDRLDALSTALNDMGKPVIQIEEPKEKPVKKPVKNK